jgi:RNA polymerase sigma factor (sigma-70 family)
VTATELKQRSREEMSGNAIRAAEGDVAAFSRLVEASEGMLYRVCRTILRSEADCADAVQETVITAWRRIAQLRNSASFPAWAARICINRCYAIARTRKPQEGFDEPQSTPRNDERLDVMAAVKSLPEDMRLTVAFYYFEDWNIREIARTLGVFEGTVKSRLFRARKLLSETLSDYKEGKRDDAR